MNVVYRSKTKLSDKSTSPSPLSRKQTYLERDERRRERKNSNTTSPLKRLNTKLSEIKSRNSSLQHDEESNRNDFSLKNMKTLKGDDLYKASSSPSLIKVRHSFSQEFDTDDKKSEDDQHQPPNLI